MRSAGAQQIYFKYCSTFDSTPKGNIGPVIDALMDDLGTDFTIATPAFPDNGRSVFKGHLFVGDRLLSESGMKDHPLTPMTDPDLVRVLTPQTRHSVGLIDYATVAAGHDAVRARIDELHADGVGIAIVDAITNDDLLRLGPAIADLAPGHRRVRRRDRAACQLGIPLRRADAAALPAATGLQAIVSGSVSVATNTQVAEFHRTGRPSFQVDALRIAAGQDVVTEALAFADRHLASGPVLVLLHPDSIGGTRRTERARRNRGGLLGRGHPGTDCCGPREKWCGPADRRRRRNVGSSGPRAAVDAVVHLASAVSAEAEADFDLGMTANLQSTLALLEAARHQRGEPATVVFSSSVAVYGSDPALRLPDVVSEATLPTPQSSYGAQKFICEQLVADYTRKGFIDGRVARLMTVAVRPGKPNAAASGFLSGIIREPLAGITTVCPVRPELSVALASPRRTVEGLLRVAQAERGDDSGATCAGASLSTCQHLL